MKRPLCTISRDGESRLHDNGQVPSAPTYQRGCSGASIQHLPYRLTPTGGSLKWDGCCFFPITAFAIALFYRILPPLSIVILHNVQQCVLVRSTIVAKFRAVGVLRQGFWFILASRKCSAGASCRRSSRRIPLFRLCRRVVRFYQIAKKCPRRVNSRRGHSWLLLFSGSGGRSSG